MMTWHITSSRQGQENAVCLKVNLMVYAKNDSVYIQLRSARISFLYNYFSYFMSSNMSQPSSSAPLGKDDAGAADVAHTWTTLGLLIEDVAAGRADFAEVQAAYAGMDAKPKLKPKVRKARCLNNALQFLRNFGIIDIGLCEIMDKLWLFCMTRPISRLISLFINYYLETNLTIIFTKSTPNQTPISLAGNYHCLSLLSHHKSN